MSIVDIYDFEGQVENACAKVIKTFGLDAYSAQDAPRFQTVRPRAEVFFNKGAGLSKFVSLDPATFLPIAPGGSITDPKAIFYMRRESAWNCTIRFDLITQSDISVHSDKRAYLRAILAIIWQLINGPDSIGGLTNHVLQMEADGGETAMVVAPEKAWYKTSMTFRGKISVVFNAWTALQS